MKNFLLIVLLFASCVLLFTRCFVLNDYIKTDAELDEHYSNSSVKPVYKKSELNDRNQHYAVLSKSDTLPLLVMVHGAPGAWYGYLNLTDDSLLQEHIVLAIKLASAPIARASGLKG